MTARIETITFPPQDIIINHLNSKVAVKSIRLQSIPCNQIIAETFANQTFSKDNIIKIVAYEFHILKKREEPNSTPPYTLIPMLIEIYSEALKNCPNTQ
ncbi:MAG: hypothetical protein COT84_04520 [Chlamydiae bacterium CG10_big_fil_rev_8_21_14_0_10_35_9]|nr:MAG: hypothetical protein COT84_04520 [Chlamydiae bacterium CG10_big_fil_rev_8_21_14_0_10_35_9]